VTTAQAATLARIQEASFARASQATQDAFPPERRMDGPGLLAFLSSATYAVLATTRPDGRPQAAPVGYALVGGKIVIASLADAARVRNLQNKPYASIVISRGEGDEHATVLLEGTARLIEPPQTAPLEMRAPFRDADGSLKPWIGTFIVISPERVMSYAAPDALRWARLD